MTVNITPSQTWSFFANVQVLPQTQHMNHALHDPKEIKRRGEILSSVRCSDICECVWLMYFVVRLCTCKLESSDDIIITVLETDGRSLCFGLCFHLKGNQSLHKLLNLIKPQADTLIQRALLFLTFSGNWGVGHTQYVASKCPFSTGKGASGRPWLQ